MGLAYLATFVVDFYGKLVGKYIPYMDPKGNSLKVAKKHYILSHP